jgi:hypothetical protein
MTRIRTVKPEFFRHEELFDCEERVKLPLRLAFVGLWTCCDREGRFRWRPRSLKCDILPYDVVDFGEVLNALADGGFIVRYSHQGKEYGYIPSWRVHQFPNSREQASQLPSPYGDEEKNAAPKKTFNKVMKTTKPLDVPCVAEVQPTTMLNSTEAPDLSPAVEESVVLQSTLDTSPVVEEPVALQSTLDTSPAIVEPVVLPNILDPSPASMEPVDVVAEPVAKPAEQSPKKEPQLEDYASPAGYLAARLRSSMGGALPGQRSPAMQKVSRAPERKAIESKAAKNIDLNQQVQQLFEHWKARTAHAHAQLDPKRKTVIETALNQGYSVNELSQAVDGCCQTPFNMGDNERGQRYDGLQVILRDADQIDRFIHNANHPPTVTQQKTPWKRVDHFVQDWLHHADLPTEVSDGS